MNWVFITVIVFIFAGGLAISWTYVTKADNAIKRRAAEHMAGRPRRSSLEFGQEFYPEQARIAADVREIFADIYSG